MNGFSTELKVGAFAIVVFCVLGFMTFKAGGLSLTGSKGYTLYVFFDNIEGLDAKSRVKIAGIDAGVVDGIDLAGGKARVKLRINSGIRLYRNSSASIKTSGLMGDKYIELGPGTPDTALLKNGDTMENVTQVVDADELARNVIAVSKNFSRLADNVNDIIGSEETKDSLSRTIVNLRDISMSLKGSVDVNDAKLRRVLDNINSLTASLNALVENNREQFSTSMSNVRDLSAAMKARAPELIDNLDKTTTQLKEMIEENRPAMKRTFESIDNITTRVDRGEGSLGKLVNDEELYDSVNKAVAGVNKTLSAVDNFRTFVDFRGEYLAKPKSGKGYFYLTLQPSRNTSYILGAIGDPVATVSRSQTITTPPGTSVTTEEIEKKIRFTAQFAKRLGDAGFRFGVTENTLGLGADYYIYGDRLKIAADAWDFSNDEESSHHPHVKAGADYFFFRNLFLSAGIDNILNSKWRGGYVGGGLRFADDDWKHIFSTPARAAVK